MLSIWLGYFDAVAFDFEGTLADTIPTHHAARMQAFATHGYGHITKEQHAMGPTYGSTTQDIVGGVLRAAGAVAADADTSTDPAVRRVIQTKSAIFSELATKGFEEMPGATDFVKALAKRFPGKVAIVTSCDESLVFPFLQRYGLTDIISAQFVIGAKTTARLGLQSKPAPDAYNLAMERLNTKKLLVFEDTAPGTAAAKSAGATVIGMGFDPICVESFAMAKEELRPDVVAKNYAAALRLLDLHGQNSL